jgi:hypothetical protein
MESEFDYTTAVTEILNSDRRRKFLAFLAQELSLAGVAIIHASAKSMTPPEQPALPRQMRRCTSSAVNWRPTLGKETATQTPRLPKLYGARRAYTTRMTESSVSASTER